MKEHQPCFDRALLDLPFSEARVVDPRQFRGFRADSQRAAKASWDGIGDTGWGNRASAANWRSKIRCGARTDARPHHVLLSSSHSKPFENTVLAKTVAVSVAVSFSGTKLLPLNGGAMLALRLVVAPGRAVTRA